MDKDTLELIEAVKLTRSLQRAYFSNTQDKEVLKKAKLAEKALDEKVRALESKPIDTKQSTMF